MKIEDLDLEPVHDFILIRDGPGPESPRLAELTGTGAENPKFVMSTGNRLYLYVYTDLGDSRKGFRIKYFSGCSVRVDADSGEVRSPAFGTAPYPANQVCTYHIHRPGGGPLSMRFSEFDVDQSDAVQ
ncbi:unnamed protein product, partial [Darwinula stevensoni]